MSVKERSVVWDYYELCEEDSTKAICLICKTIISRCGTGKSATTSSLVKHLRFVHPVENSEYKTNTDVKKNAVSSQKRHAGGSSSSCGGTLDLKLKQVDIESYSNRKWKINDKRAKLIHKAIGEMIALDNQPYTIVDDVGK